MKLLLVLLLVALPVQAAEKKVTLGGYGVIERGEGSAPQGRWTGFPVDVSLHKAPVQEVILTFARLADFNVVFDPRVQGSVTVELQDVPWDLALHMILKTHGLGAEVNGRLWRVAPR